MLLTQVLSVSSVILGFYIIGAFLLNDPKQVQTVQKSETREFHVGCFLVQHNLSHSYLLQNYMSDAAKNNKLNNQYRSANLSLDYFDRKGVQLSQQFSMFLNQFNRKKEDMNNLVQLSKEVKRSYQDYEYCSEVIKNGQNFQELQCKKTWIQHQNCSKKLNILKDRLSYLLSQKLALENKVNEVFLKTNQSQLNPKKEQRHEQKQFKFKDKQLQLEQKTLQVHIDVLKQKIEIAEYNYKVAQNQTMHSTFLYKQCSQHRKQFKLCEQVSAEVRSLGHGTLESLWSKVDRKRLAIIKIKSMMNDQIDRSERLQYEQLRNRSLDEYKRLHRIFIHTKSKINKNCGCTEAQEQKLLMNVNNHQIQQQKAQQELRILSKKLQQSGIELAKTKQKRRVLFSQFEQQIKASRVTKNPSSQINTVEVLNNLQLEQKQLKNKILQYENQFVQLSLSCRSYQEQLSSLLTKISYISDCRLKKEYYQKMYNQLMQQKQKFHLQLHTKNRLIQKIWQFRI